MHLIAYLLHYIFARALYDLLVGHGVAPLAAFLLAGAVLWFLTRRRGRGRQGRWQR